MAQGRMLPADPRWGGVYGWVHLDESGGFVCLRNPGIVERRIDVALPELGARFYQATRVYPFEETVELDNGIALDVRDRVPRSGMWRLRTGVEPFGVTVIEVKPRTGPEAGAVSISGARGSIVDRTPGAVRYDFWGQPNTTACVLVCGDVQRTEPQQENRTVNLGVGFEALSLRFPGRPYHLWDVKAVDDSGRRFGVTVDEGVDWRFVVVAHGAGKTSSVALLVDGVGAEAQRVSGEGWELFACDVPKGSHQVAWSVPEAAQTEPFSSPGYWVESFFVREAKLVPVRVTIASERGDKPLRQVPQTPNAGIERSTWVGPKVAIEGRQSPLSVAVTEQDLATAKAAKLHLKVFGSQGGDDYGRKWIVLNGERIAAVPANSNASDPDRWEDFVIDLSPAQAKLLKLQNEVAIEAQTGDCFKFADLALAAQLADGRWAESEHSDGVWCSAPGWLHDEGKTFSGKTPPSRLLFRTK